MGCTFKKLSYLCRMNENASNLKIVYRPTATLNPYVNNSNSHSTEQVAGIAASINEFGFTNPLLIDENGTLIAGHGRLLAADSLGLEEVPCIVLAHLTEAQRRAYVIADNQLAKKSTWDLDMLALELDALAGMNYDLSVTGFDMAEIDAILRGDDFLPDGAAPGASYTGVSQPLPTKYADGAGSKALLKKFGIPPFSIFDTRQGYWQDRKKAWLALVGDTSATKEDTLSNGTILTHINKGSSGFDPVLAEIIYTWFCSEGGKILDPFGGEQTKGFVAGYMGLKYSAVEFRKDQVEYNQAICVGMDGVQFVTGDSNDISKLIPGRDFDLVFTSPPYYDLEVYSAEDMSALGSYAEFMSQYENIFAQCVAMLADNRFVVVKIGEVRDKATGEYRNFVGDNITMFKRLGLVYYNEIILLNQIGTAAIRADRSFRNRKIVKTHQNILVFYKGNPADIQKHFSQVEFQHDLDTTADDNEN